MIAMIMDEPVGWCGNRALFNIDNWDNVAVSAQLTPVGINFYRWYNNKWNRYERLLFDKCEVDMNYPNYIFIKTKQPRSRRLVDILENRG